MLASADYPNLINKNVKDCFDGIKNWEMKPLDAKNKSDTILAMCSADNGEVVTFDEPFVCKGQLVEVYLKEFEEKIMLKMLKQDKRLKTKDKKQEQKFKQKLIE